MFKNPRILVVGAGFGGFKLVKALQKKLAGVLLVNRSDYHNSPSLKLPHLLGPPRCLY